MSGLYQEGSIVDLKSQDFMKTTGLQTQRCSRITGSRYRANSHAIHREENFPNLQLFVIFSNCLIVPFKFPMYAPKKPNGYNIDTNKAYNIAQIY